MFIYAYAFTYNLICRNRKTPYTIFVLLFIIIFLFPISNDGTIYAKYSATLILYRRSLHPFPICDAKFS